MIRREVLLPPEHIYPPDDWRMLQTRFASRFVAQDETIFSVGNGYLGMRGNFEEGRPVSQNGTFINGFYEAWPIEYPEEAYGFAKAGQTMVNVADGKIIRLYVDDEPFFLPTAHLLSFERALDMRAGTLDREVLWETPSGKQVSIRSRRLVSFEHRHLAAISYEVTVLNAEAPVVISSEVLVRQHEQGRESDPRQAPGFEHRVLEPRIQTASDGRLLLAHETSSSALQIACAAEHVLETECNYTFDSAISEDEANVVYSIDARPGTPISLVKYLAYHTSQSSPPREVADRTHRTLDRAVQHGFDSLLTSQRSYLDDFWDRSDVLVEGGDPRTQQLARFNLFHIFQAAARAEGTGIGARGLTGLAYEGHYFWDAEIYVLPFLIYTSPQVAKNVLRFRHTHLDDARQRAAEMSESGALFPWRTITGKEASAYYAAGTAQYHINADIAFTVRKYVEASGDQAFLEEFGAEILVETARLWADLGFYSDSRDGRFCIHGVTGPDEYNTVVNNNAFTNLMARENLRYAAETVRALRADRPAAFAQLVHRTDLGPTEVEDWERAAERMFVPYDEHLGVHLQDELFPERERWDFENTPLDKYPLLLHFHPLVIYRHRVIKQADIVLAMFLLGREFSDEQKKRNFDYYDPLTTGDSSLSACIQSIMAAEIGYSDVAGEYLSYAALMDLADIGGNVKDGTHIASMGGTWMALVYGVAGMRDYGGHLSFRPRLHGKMRRLRFPLTIQGRRLEVDLQRDQVSYLLRDGDDFTIEHFGERLTLSEGKAEIRTLSSD